MSSRERWTVYPLLFLTLGIALKDKIVKLVNVDTVICKTLEVTDQQGNARVIVSSNASGGIVKADNPQGVSVAVGHYANRAGLMFLDPRGNLVPGVGYHFLLNSNPSKPIPARPDSPPAAPADAEPAQQPAEAAPNEGS